MLNEVEDEIGHFDSFTNPNLPAVDNAFTTVTYTEIYENGVEPQEALDQAQSDIENQVGQ